MQFAGGNGLLIRRFIDCVGRFGPSCHLLVSFALVLCPHHSFCRRDRLHGQLAEESLVSLRRCSSSLRRSSCLTAWVSLASCWNGNTRSVPLLNRPDHRVDLLFIGRQPWFSRLPARWLLRCSSSSDHSEPRDLSIESRAKPSIASPISRSARRKPRRTAW